MDFVKSISAYEKSKAGGILARIASAWLSAYEERATRTIEDHLISRGCSRLQIAAIRTGKTPAGSN
ncbi:MAG: hypothetical protein IT561_02565 [Alphaproteobacteria bacterium]|nr:hypothetical protein [Alphaproteobacteria bacterium]